MCSLSLPCGLDQNENKENYPNVGTRTPVESTSMLNHASTDPAGRDSATDGHLDSVFSPRLPRGTDGQARTAGNLISRNGPANDHVAIRKLKQMQQLEQQRRQQQRFASAHTAHRNRECHSPKQRVREQTGLEALMAEVIQWPQKKAEKIFGQFQARVPRLNLIEHCTPGNPCTMLENIIEGEDYGHDNTKTREESGATAARAAGHAAKIAFMASCALALPLQNLITALIDLEQICVLINQDDRRYTRTEQWVEDAIRQSVELGKVADTTNSLSTDTEDRNQTIGGNLRRKNGAALSIYDEAESDSSSSAIFDADNDENANTSNDASITSSHPHSKMKASKSKVGKSTSSCQRTATAAASSRSRPSAFSFAPEHIRRSYRRQLHKLIQEYKAALQTRMVGYGTLTERGTTTSTSSMSSKGNVNRRSKSRELSVSQYQYPDSINVLPLLTQLSEAELLGRYQGQEERLLQKVKASIVLVYKRKAQEASQRRRARKERARRINLASSVSAITELGF